MASLAEMMFQSASNSIANTGQKTPDVAGSFVAGAQLAQAREKFEMQKQEFEYKKQQLEVNKHTIIGQDIINMRKNLPPNIWATYLKESVAPKAAQMGIPMSEVAQKLYASNEFNADAYAASISDLYAALGSGTQIPGNVFNDIVQMHNGNVENASEYVRKAQHAVAQQKLAQANQFLTQTRFEENKRVQAEKRLSDLTIQFNNEVDKRFKDLTARRDSIRTAYTELNTIQADLRKGKKADIISFNAVSRAVAKIFDSGPMTDRDVGDFRELTGLENITRDAVNRWITGNVNPQTVGQLLRLSKRIAGNLDKKAAVIETGLNERIKGTPEFAGREDTIRQASGLNAQMRPTLQQEIDKLLPPAAIENFRKARTQGVNAALSNDEYLRKVSDALKAQGIQIDDQELSRLIFKEGIE